MSLSLLTVVVYIVQDDLLKVSENRSKESSLVKNMFIEREIVLKKLHIERKKKKEKELARIEFEKMLIGNGEEQGGGGGYSKPGRSLKRSEMNDIDSRSENGSNGKWNFPAFVPPE